MNFKMNKAVLNNAIKKVSGAINPNTPIPALTGMHLAANQDSLTITGGDSDLFIRTFIPSDETEGVEIIEEGSIILPAKELAGIAQKMPKDLIAFATTDETKMQISSGKSNFTLNGANGSDYPKLPKVEGDSYPVKGQVLQELVEKTAYATSNMETRPVLTGANLFHQEGSIGMVATDSHRLSKVVGEEQLEGDISPVTIPEKTLQKLPKLIGDAETVHVKQTDSQIMFQTEEIQVFSRLLDGNYPQTDRLISAEHKTRLTTNRKDFLSSMERSTILAEKGKQIVTLEIKDENSGIFETIKLSHNSDEVGQSIEDIIVDETEGEEIKISFNAQFMIDALKRIDDEKVVIEFNGAMRPFIIKPENKTHFIQLILPVRTY
ncbi:DNA polymerase III subunit beta [Lentibacillus salinarum]|uniref:Beta sliding clamp n=1 Tax=Lentibacillus salinarum TaxID=446820 RepID=A0ABW3ZYA6_9BACI